MDFNGVPAPVTTPLTASRLRLTPSDPDRALVYLSCVDGNLGQFKLNGQPVPRTQLCYGEDPTDSAFHGGLTLPANTAPGTYQVDAGRGPELTITVVAAPIRRTAIVSTFGQFQRAVQQGYLDITLSPGRYDWTAPVTLPANFILRGDGAVIRRLPVTNLGTNWPALVIGGNDVSVYGCTFNYDAIGAGGMVFFANPTASGLVLGDCSFRRCNFGFYFSQSYVRDCTFLSAGAGPAPSALFVRDTFTGPPAYGDPLQIWNSGFQGIDLVFNGTSRGPVFNASGGPIEGCLFAGTRLNGINATPNGNECFLCEGGALNRSLFLHTRMSGCLSTAYQFDGGSDGVLVSDHFQDGGLGLYVNAGPGKVVRNLTVRSSEFQRCGVYAGPNSDGFSLTDTSVVAFANSRGNQSWPNPAPWMWRITAVQNEGPPTNSTARLNITQLPAGCVAQSGFAIGPAQGVQQ